MEKPKSILIGKSEVDGMKNSLGDEITFLNIPVVRCKEVDIVNFRGENIVRSKIEGIIRKEKHEKELDEILVNPHVTHCHIMKRGRYYRDNRGGYTESKLVAGVYTKEDACSQARNILELRIEPINNREHNDYLNTHIEGIKKRLVPEL